MCQLFRLVAASVLCLLAATSGVRAACGTCRADFDNSGFVDNEDYDSFILAFEAGDQVADFDGSGFVDTDDFDAFVCAYITGCGLDFNHNGKADCQDLDTYMDAYAATAPLADFNCDGSVDASDLALFQAQFQHELIEFTCDGLTTCDDFDAYLIHWVGGLVTADMNCDGFVRSDDFNLFVDAWTFARVDANGSGVIDCADAALFGQRVSNRDPLADFNCNGVTDAADLQGYMTEFHKRCPSCGC